MIRPTDRRAAKLRNVIWAAKRWTVIYRGIGGTPDWTKGGETLAQAVERLFPGLVRKRRGPLMRDDL